MAQPVLSAMLQLSCRLEHVFPVQLESTKLALLLALTVWQIVMHVLMEQTAKIAQLAMIGTEVPALSLACQIAQYAQHLQIARHAITTIHGMVVHVKLIHPAIPLAQPVKTQIPIFVLHVLTQLNVLLLICNAVNAHQTNLIYQTMPLLPNKLPSHFTFRNLRALMLLCTESTFQMVQFTL